MRKEARVLAALAVLVLSGLRGAEGRAEPSGAAFLTIPSSPRAFSLGQSGAVSALGAQAVGANPANLGFLERKYEVFSSYGSLSQGAEYEHVAAAFGTAGIAPDYVPLEAGAGWR